LEYLQQASVASTPLSHPAKQELLHSIITRSKTEGFDMGEWWIEAISEADRIRDQRLVESESLHQCHS